MGNGTEHELLQVINLRGATVVPPEESRFILDGPFHMFGDMAREQTHDD